VNGEVPSNGALGRLIWPAGLDFHLRSVDPHRGGLQFRKVSVIRERISQSSNLLVAPHHDLGEKLAPQA
jgi:hypothetical protein